MFGFSLIIRFFESVFFGACLEILCVIIIGFCFDTTALLIHFQSIYNLNASYLSDNFVILTGISPYLHHWSIHLLPSIEQIPFINDGLESMVFCIILAMVVVIQKLIIVLITLPVYILFKILASFDGLISREIRRYRAGFESTRREYITANILRFERFIFIGFVALPFYIPAVLWFGIFGVFVAVLQQIKISYVQKYI